MIFKPPLQGILFDFDGLILDTESPIFQAWQEMFRNYDQELLLEEWAEILGKAVTISGTIEDFLQSKSSEEERMSILAEVSRREQELVQQQKPLPGAKELMETAKQRGLRLGIVSSSDQKWVQGHLTRLGLLKYFDHTSCADEVANAKPDPELYYLGVKKMGVLTERVVVLEDSPNGVLAAKRAGLYCLAIPNELTRQLPFFKNGGMPDRVLDSLIEFPWDELMKDDL